MQASSNNLPTFYQLWKNPALIRFSIQNIKFTSTVLIHYIYGETSGVYMDQIKYGFLLFGKTQSRLFCSFIETCYGLG